MKLIQNYNKYLDKNILDFEVKIKNSVKICKLLQKIL